MLQIGHRDSFDIDIFLDDAQLLGFLDPSKQNLHFERMPSAYQGDGLRFQKFVFAGVGEIDFIVATSLTDPPTVARLVADRQVNLETIPEIIVKKVHYRGRSIQSRDIFDIAVATTRHEGDLRIALTEFKPDVHATLERMKRLNPVFVETAIGELAIRPEFDHLAKQALTVAIDFLASVSSSA